MDGQSQWESAERVLAGRSGFLGVVVEVESTYQALYSDRCFAKSYSWCRRNRAAIQLRDMAKVTSLVMVD